ncbi:histone-fold-containing protein [Athelia psychrophila]|uniref:Histone-fold-containing protein n=1 Tax=Athelia psychrophila TaxID=1759441 RepID=A0A166LDV2_9AGAM|nr:histone-fold-containing protein [Fibularhizoctonia sp. CBS 109695]KZP24205.1 histone-fold-containing protein [Fibularhizoctonia sp. CBS 109695]
MKNKNKQTKFPVARIKKIMQKDEEVGKVAQATPIVISKALELFLAMITEESSKVTVDRGAKKVEVYHLKHAVETTEMLDFLKEIVEGVPDPSAGGTIDLEAENEAKRKRGKGKKVEDGGEEKPKRVRKKKKKEEDEEEADIPAQGAGGDEDDEDEEDEKPSGSGWKTKPGKEAWRGDR